MFKRENLRKNFLRVKQNIDQNLGRAEKSEVLSEDQQENEKRVDVVKHAFQNIAKKAGAVLQAPGTEFEKRLKKLPETGLGNAMVESATALGLDTLLGSVCQLCGDAQLNLAREQVQYDVTVEQEFVTPLQNIVDIDIPSIIKFRKALNKSTLDMDSAKTRYNQAVRQSHFPGANIANAMAKADVINEEYEEASQKVESIKDNLSIELCNFAAKESEHSNRLLLLLEAQATYHKKALEAIEGCIPQMRLAIQNSPTKPCYGMPLEEHLRLMCRDIAVVLEACITTLLEFGMEEEGLFRIAGAAMKLKKLKACFDAHAVDMEEFHTDPHTVAGALKQYLRELPEPLLTYALYEDFMQTANLPQDQRLQKLWTVISRLPTPNYNNFRYLVKFLSKLAEKSDVNKMKPSNIAIVIGPNLLWSEKNNAPNMLSTGTVSAIIEAIVTHADWFFPGAYDFQLTGHGSSPKPCREPGFTFNAKSELASAKTTEKAETNVKESVQEGEKEGRGNGDGSEGGDKAKIITTEKGGLSPKVEFQIAKPNLAVAETEDSEGSSSDENNPFSEKYEAKNQGVTESEVQNGKLEKGDNDSLSSQRFLLGGRPNHQCVAPNSTNTGDYDNIGYTVNPLSPVYGSGTFSRASTLSSHERRGSADNLMSYKQSPAPVPPSRPSRPSKRFSPLSSDQNSPFSTLSSSGSYSPHSSSQRFVENLAYQPPSSRQPNSRYLTGSTPNINSLSYNRYEEDPYSGFQGSLWNRPNQKSSFSSLKRGSDPCIIPPPPQFGNLSNQRPLKISRAQLGTPPKPGEMPRSQMQSSQEEISRSPSRQGQSHSHGSSPGPGQGTMIDKSFHQDAYSTAFALTSLGAGNKSTDYLTRVRAMWDDRHSQPPAGKADSPVEKSNQGNVMPREQSFESKPEMTPRKGCPQYTKSQIGTAGGGGGLVSSSPGHGTDFDFTNVGYHYEEDQEGEQTEVEKPDNNSNALHVQAVSNQPPSLQASPGSPVVSAAHSSSDSLPVPSDSLELSSPVLRRVARKPAPPPPPERPFTVMVTATTGLPGNDNSTSSYNQCQTWPRSTPAPLASPESPTEQHKTANPENRQSVRLSSGHSERPSVPPPERPGQAPPDRPRLPPSLNPPVGKGHQRSASTGAMVHQSVGSFDSSHVAGLPNAEK